MHGGHTMPTMGPATHRVDKNALVHIARTTATRPRTRPDAISHADDMTSSSPLLILNMTGALHANGRKMP